MNSPSEHRIHRIGWLRAAVLGANDGIVSTSSLIIGVASSGAVFSDILLAGTAGLVAGAMSMAAGEYVSVSSQADTEAADIELEKRHLNTDYEFEIRELTSIYVKRGLNKNLAKQVAIGLMNYDALGAHARDELGITETSAPRPFLAALVSAGAFSIGALLPLLATVCVSHNYIVATVALSSLLFLGVLGAFSAHMGRAPFLRAIVRVTGWGAFAMLTTAMVGCFFSTTF